MFRVCMLLVWIDSDPKVLRKPQRLSREIEVCMHSEGGLLQSDHTRNYALLHENQDFGSKISDFEQRCVRVVFLYLAFGFTAVIHSEIACIMPFQRSNILKIRNFPRT